MNERAAGVLMHVTSLPGSFGVGDLGYESRAFVNWLREGEQAFWQILPLGPTGLGNSPFTTTSAFAGNPLLISPASLVDDALLPDAWLAEVPEFSRQRVEYEVVSAWKRDMLRASWRQFRSAGSPAVQRQFDDFSTRPDTRYWLDDWALYCALKQRFSGSAWRRWPTELRQREPSALHAASGELIEQLAYHRYLQFLFDRQWSGLRAECGRLGIRLIGDLPMYVAEDSADVWAQQELFHLESGGRPLAVSGVPPDAFSPTGQLWGHPTYRWDRARASGYTWWIERLRNALQRTDCLRLDHFRGFASYWEIPTPARTAENGRWRPGPGIELFDALANAVGPLPLIAEDLGQITTDVEQLLGALSLPGMKVLQFGFGSTESEHRPERITENTVVYTGTHDNDTAVGWFRGIDEVERRRALALLESDGSEVHWDLIRTAYTSPARLAITPLQDILGLPSEARMNRPGQTDGCWEWRTEERLLTEGLASRLAELARRTGRSPASEVPRPSPAQPSHAS